MDFGTPTWKTSCKTLIVLHQLLAIGKPRTDAMISSGRPGLDDASARSGSQASIEQAGQLTYATYFVWWDDSRQQQC